MGLLEELVNRRAQKTEQYHEYQGVVQKWIGKVSDVSDELEELDRAIAALTPPAQAVEAEPAIPEGFTKWEGGERLLDATLPVAVVLRNGGVSDMWTAGQWDGHWHWRGEEPDGTNIIAYRVLSSEPAAMTSDGLGDCGTPASATIEDYPDFTPEQTAAIESATAEFQSTDGAEIVSGEPWPEVSRPDAEINSGPFENDPADFTIGASAKHADESDAQMFAAGINRELEKA